MGAGKQYALMSALDALEEHNPNGEGVMAAVQARLVRRQLPVIKEDGLVEYAVLYPANGRSSGVGAVSSGADCDWIQSVGSSAPPSTRQGYSTDGGDFGEMEAPSANSLLIRRSGLIRNGVIEVIKLSFFKNDFVYDHVILTVGCCFTHHHPH